MHDQDNQIALRTLGMAMALVIGLVLTLIAKGIFNSAVWDI